MGNFKCVKCNKDLNLGLVLFTEPEIYPDNIKYLHCSDCGKTYLFDFSNVDLQEVDYTVEGISDDILESLDKAFDNLPNFEFEEESNDKKESCKDCNGTCNCNH